MFDPLPADLATAVASARARLGGFSDLRYVAETDSTNDLALALASAGEPEGVAVLADAQRRGRGRRGHEWFSPAGAGLYLSIILRPDRRDHRVPLTTLAAGVAAARAIHAITALPIELKWPNDLVIGRPWRKLGGLLSEVVGTGGRIDAVVVGIGINLRAAAYPREIAGRATAVEIELGRPIDRAPLVVELLAAMRGAARRIGASEDAMIRDEWRALGRAGLADAAVRWQDGDGAHQGRARDIDVDGALLVDVGGTIERVMAGEVTWEAIAHDR